DWAVESQAGDVFLLGTTSWRIRKVEPGTVRVVDAHGAPPSAPFWLGEAPGRTVELSDEVSRLRRDIAERLRGQPGQESQPGQGGQPGQESQPGQAGQEGQGAQQSLSGQESQPGQEGQPRQESRPRQEGQAGA